MKLKYVVLFLAVTLFILPFAITNIDSDHDGILLKPALDVASGKVLFRDTYTQYGALTVFIQAATLKITPFLLGIRLSAVYAYAFLAVFLYLIWRRFLSEKLTLVSLILWLSLAPFYNFYFHPWSSVYALVFQMASLLCLFRFFERKKERYLVLAGAAASLAFWCRQPVGIFLAGAIFGLFILLWTLKFISLRQAGKNISFLLIGITASSIPFLLYLAANHAYTDWWKQSFLAASSWAAVVRGISVIQVIKSLSIAKFWKEIHLYFIWLALPLSAVFLFFHSLKTLKSRLKQILILASSVVLFASWMQYYPITDPSHFFWAATPMVGFFTYVLHRFVFPRLTSNIKLLTSVFTLFVITALIWRTSVGLERVRKADKRVEGLTILAGIRVTPEEKQTIESFTADLSKYANRKTSYLNTTPDSFVSLLLPDRFHSFPPLYAHWEYADRVYTDYLSRVDAYIRAKHPIFVTRWGPYFDNYCGLSSFFDPATNLYVFRPNIITLKKNTDTYTLRVSFGSSGELTSILLKQRDDENPLYPQDQKLPFSYQPGSSITIPFTKEMKAENSLLKFVIKEKDFDECSLIKTVPRK